MEYLNVLEKLIDFTHWMSHLLMGIDQLSTGILSAAILHPQRLSKFLHKVVQDVTQKHSDFVPLYTELYHYYETDQVSFTNTEDMLLIQIPIFSVNKNQ